MARSSRARVPALDAPRGRSVIMNRSPQPSRDRFGRFTEWIARAMGTPWFLLGLSLFCVLWLIWNTMLPAHLRFDSADNGFTALTLVLSLQASYAAPLILLAQNRQDDRDRVQIEQDRQRAERNLADTEYLAREIVALRMAMTDVSSEAVTRDVLRDELKALLEDLDGRASGESLAVTAKREERRRRTERREKAERDARDR
ncbi:DUF1003 domain-containing protein [Microbacterium sp. cx-55]|uniref:DUF1003 domain-containing protein n=1 Tax=unclassified Microbacterium TaxID=2609290 RepID=UPI001CC0283C|nr:MULTISPECIES: DUF1003 domain-containing protein [unclassified Microbacterium]MBZ4485908.1 DUF1003 domain-containing protein [Microbacterium sp. cx-55]MCC4906869.1 DUF1003 domain-containing protein [Microbacterium sp. cx-59]UGB34216.1 DUF1003 domain-containing protein [Microbacterium sp. cx-55]